MTRRQVYRAVLLERFGTFDLSAERYVNPKTVDFPVVHDFGDYDPRPWAHRDGYADDMFDQFAA